MSKKLDGLKIAREIAASRGGRCLSHEYISSKTNMEWECKEKHQWLNCLNNIKNSNQWCAECVGQKMDGLRIAHEIAVKWGGKCLSKKYINNHTDMHWECEKKHRWYACLSNIKFGNTWCLECSGKKKLSIEIAQQIAIKRGGRCLSINYIDCTHKLLWECYEKHKWRANLQNIKNNNSWCPECSLLCGAKNTNNSAILRHWKTDEELICQASYEKAVVEYLNANKINFRWQSKTFKTPFLKLNGEKRTYRPDLYLFSTKKWIEIKGYFRKDAQEKWDWFRKEHPNSELWNKEKLKEMGLI